MVARRNGGEGMFSRWLDRLARRWLERHGDSVMLVRQLPTREYWLYTPLTNPVRFYWSDPREA